MPIVGLTDQTPALKEIGRIRKGDEKKDDYRPGKNLNYFRVTFQHDSEETNLARKNLFEGHYDDQPREIRVQLAYDTYDANWFAWYTCYLKGGMLGMADGERWFYLRDYRNHEVAITNYSLTEYGKAHDFNVEFDPKEAVYFYQSKRKKEDIPVFATPEGRLSVVMPDLFGRFNMFQALTNSVHDIRQLSGELKSIAVKADAFGIPMSDIPLVYSRREEIISKPMKNGRAQVGEWLCHIQPAEEWDMLASKLLERKAIYAMLPKTTAEVDAEGIAALVEPIDSAIAELEAGEIIDDPVEVSTGGNQDPTEESGDRPYTPEMLRKKFASAIAQYDNKSPDYKVIAKLVKGILPDEIDRYAVTRWITGNESGSTKHLTPPQKFAFSIMLTGDAVAGFDSQIKSVCKTELNSALVAAQAKGIK